MADALTAPFTMHGARYAIAGGLVHIEEQVKGIERAVVENPGLAFDLAKTVVESTCRSILTERNITFGTLDDLPKLFRAVTTNLPLLPDFSEQRGRRPEEPGANAERLAHSPSRCLRVTQRLWVRISWVIWTASGHGKCPCTACCSGGRCHRWLFTSSS
jgi:hypothetical protein